jgi:hypothetical protein
MNNGTSAFIERVIEAQSRNGLLTQDTLASYAGVSRSHLCAVLAGDKNPSPEVVRNVDAVLNQIAAGTIQLSASGPVRTRSFSALEMQQPHARLQWDGKIVLTPLIVEMGKILAYCIKRSAIALVTADFGAGKSVAVDYWTARGSACEDAAVFEFDEFSKRAKTAFVGCLAAHLGLHVKGGNHAGGANFSAVVDFFVSGEPRLLILDQCDSVGVPVFQVVRQLRDKVLRRGGKLGIVIVGPPILRQRLEAARTSDLGALISRIPRRLRAALRGIDRAEMAAIVKSRGFHDVTEEAFALWYSVIGGSMRELSDSLDVLEEKHAGRRVTELTIRQVLNLPVPRRKEVSDGSN